MNSMEKKFCTSSPDGFHKVILGYEGKEYGNDWTQRDERGLFKKVLLTYKQYRCDYCFGRWIIKLDQNQMPVDKKLYAELFVRDFIQPHHKDYERIYGKDNREKIVSEFEEIMKANKFKEETKGNIADFKEHYAHGRKWY